MRLTKADKLLVASMAMRGWPPTTINRRLRPAKAMSRRKTFINQFLEEIGLARQRKKAKCRGVR